MNHLNKNIVHFLESQAVVLVASISPAGTIHCSIKGIVEVQPSGIIHIIDLFTGRTYRNLLTNPHISLTAFDYDRFTGYTLQGQARIIPKDKIAPFYMEEWSNRIAQRISERLVQNVQKKTKGSFHYEAHLPQNPRYMIEVSVANIIPLAPQLTQ